MGINPLVHRWMSVCHVHLDGPSSSSSSSSSSSFLFRPLSSSPPHAINPSPCARLCTNAEELLCLIASVFVGQTRLLPRLRRFHRTRICAFWVSRWFFFWELFFSRYFVFCIVFFCAFERERERERERESERGGIRRTTFCCRFSALIFTAKVLVGVAVL